tara:strand:+ start:9834 stop:10892 length:1059 start_codon:yes stop_codon:yes gene_type:complete
MPSRDEIITVKQAKEIFNRYYREKHAGSPEKIFMAQLYDMMYQKQAKYTIKCNSTKNPKKINGNMVKSGECEKGSIRYANAQGPKTFDIPGIDSFPERSQLPIANTKSTKKHYSRGYSTTMAGDTGEVYGPRVGGKTLYKGYFGTLLQNRANIPGFKPLIQTYWDKRRDPANKSNKKYDRTNKNWLDKLGSRTVTVAMGFLSSDSMYDIRSAGYTLGPITLDSGKIYKPRARQIAIRSYLKLFGFNFIKNKQGYRIEINDRFLFTLTFNINILTDSKNKTLPGDTDPASLVTNKVIIDIHSGELFNMDGEKRGETLIELYTTLDTDDAGDDFNIEITDAVAIDILPSTAATK